MSGIRIVTDTASDITAQQAQQMNVRLVPLSIAFGERKMPMESEEDFQSFFEQLYEERELPTTGPALAGGLSQRVPRGGKESGGTFWC